MKKRRNIQGMTLLEVMMAIMISTGVLAGLFAFFIPWVRVFQSLISNNDYRTALISTMDVIEKEASDMLTIYVDPTKCYAACMVDDLGNRIYYYYDQGSSAAYRNLYRKKEPVSNVVACSGGKVISRNLKYSETEFSALNSLFTVKLVGRGDSTTTNPFPVYSAFFPAMKERKYLFTEGFECNSLASGWTVTSGAGSTWSVATTSSGQGKYVVVDTQAGGASNTSTLEVPIDLARVSTAQLKFNYFNDGTIGVPDSFTADFYDGASWKTLFSDTTGAMILSPKSVTADLSGYTLSQTNKVRFSGALRTSGSHWYVDEIQIYNP